MLLSQASLLLLGAFSLCSANDKLVRMTLDKKPLKKAAYRRSVSTGCDPSAPNSLCIKFVPYNNGFYSANVTFTGNQTFSMLLDTGSADFWVYSVNSTTTNSSLASSGVLWDTSMSNGTVTNFTTGIVYADGAASNYTWWRETVQAGTLTVPMSWVGASPFANSGYDTAEIAQEGFSGIIGLAYPALNTGYGDGVTPWVNNMVSAGVISEPVFGFYAASNYSSNATIAEITFGGFDKAHYTGNLTYYDVIPSFPQGYGPNSTNSTTTNSSSVSSQFGFYAINVTSLTMGDNSTNMLNNTQTFILDSGTSFLSLPHAAYVELMNQFNGTEIAAGTANAGIEGVEIPCDKVANAPNLTFTIGSEKYVIPGSQWVTSDPTRSIAGVECFLQLYDTGTGSNDTFSIFGDTFFRSYYVGFNQTSNQVALAPHA